MSTGWGSNQVSCKCPIFRPNPVCDQPLHVCLGQRLAEPSLSSLSSDSIVRPIGLIGGGSPCAGIPEVMKMQNDILRCALQKEEAGVFCRELECGTALQWFRDHPGGLLGVQEQRYVSCQGTEPSIFHCKINRNFVEQCDLQVYTEVVCTGRVTPPRARDSFLCMNKEIKISAPSTQAVLRESSSPVLWLKCQELSPLGMLL